MKLHVAAAVASMTALFASPARDCGAADVCGEHRQRHQSVLDFPAVPFVWRRPHQDRPLRGNCRSRFSGLRSGDRLAARDHHRAAGRLRGDFGLEWHEWGHHHPAGT